MKNTELIEAVFDKIENLPTLPGIAIKILEAVQKKEPDIDEIGKLISTDPPLSVKVLKVVNSCFYSLAVYSTSLTTPIGVSSKKT